MKPHSTALFAAILMLIGLQSADAEPASGAHTAHPAAVKLNNEGVEAMRRALSMDDNNRLIGELKDSTSYDWQPIFDKFEAAIEIDPEFDLARENLAIAHNNCALRKRTVAEALREFHRALYVDE